jgi:hypothetical protein
MAIDSPKDPPIVASLLDRPKGAHEPYPPGMMPAAKKAPTPAPGFSRSPSCYDRAGTPPDGIGASALKRLRFFLKSSRRRPGATTQARRRASLERGEARTSHRRRPWLFF